jgi:hypothetical protein
LSTDEGLHFRALARIVTGITAALPARHELAASLPSSLMPGAPYDLKKAFRIIANWRQFDELKVRRTCQRGF